VVYADTPWDAPTRVRRGTAQLDLCRTCTLGHFSRCRQASGVLLLLVGVERAVEPYKSKRRKYLETIAELSADGQQYGTTWFLFPIVLALEDPNRFESDRPKNDDGLTVSDGAEVKPDISLGFQRVILEHRHCEVLGKTRGDNDVIVRRMLFAETRFHHCAAPHALNNHRGGIEAEATFEGPLCR
jgi:hypothetical protein